MCVCVCVSVRENIMECDVSLCGAAAGETQVENNGGASEKTCVVLSAMLSRDVLLIAASGE